MNFDVYCTLCKLMLSSALPKYEGNRVVYCMKIQMEATFGRNYLGQRSAKTALIPDGKCNIAQIKRVCIC